MHPFAAAGFFDLDSFAHAVLFAPDRPVWDALGAPLDALFAGSPAGRARPRCRPAFTTSAVRSRSPLTP